ncbi:hypothetical protein ACPWSR_02340 [Alloiococcus sp. CFN-8]|uniref:hypothetical protein n=1 Tax=Alloiococcus sp. CFN-8 TaxID=3416081 RepID=UPI003CE69503
MNLIYSRERIQTMNIFKEFFISLAKPGEYKSFLKLSMIRVFIYQLSISAMGFVAFLLIELMARLVVRSDESYGELLKIVAPQNLVITIGYMWLGICLSTLLLSVLFFAIHRFRGNKEISFKQVYVYAAHALTISAIVNTYMGFYGTIVAIAFYYMAVKADGERKRLGTIGLKYKEGIK